MLSAAVKVPAGAPARAINQIKMIICLYTDVNDGSKLDVQQLGMRRSFITMAPSSNKTTRQGRQPTVRPEDLIYKDSKHTYYTRVTLFIPNNEKKQAQQPHGTFKWATRLLWPVQTRPFPVYRPPIIIKTTSGGHFHNSGHRLKYWPCTRRLLENGKSSFDGSTGTTMWTRMQ